MTVRSELDELALRKMGAVLGEARAKTLFEQTLAQLGLERVGSPDDLMRVSEALGPHGGFVAAVGAMLGVAAVLRGAQPPRKSALSQA